MSRKKHRPYSKMFLGLNERPTPMGFLTGNWLLSESQFLAPNHLDFNGKFGPTWNITHERPGMFEKIATNGHKEKMYIAYP